MSGQSKIDDGEPAFPVPTIYGRDLEVRFPPHVRGMSLRDYFAAALAPMLYPMIRADISPILKQAVDLVKGDLKATMELLESEEVKSLERDLQSRLGTLSYDLADAMLAARRKDPTP